MSSYIKAAEETEKFNTSLETLEYAGIVSVSSQGVITVARLYRPALDISMGRNSALSVAEERSLEDRVDVAIETWPQDSKSVRLPDMSAPERKFVHEYVKEKYPNYSTASSTGHRQHEFKALFVHKRAPGARGTSKSSASKSASGTNKSSYSASVSDVTSRGWRGGVVGGFEAGQEPWVAVEEGAEGVEFKPGAPGAEDAPD